jgi:hypothetical protein
MRLAESLHMTIRPMCPSKGEVIGLDPMKRQYETSTVSRCFYTVLVRQVAENSPYWT